jgi:hypothetical protein
MPESVKDRPTKSHEYVEMIERRTAQMGLFAMGMANS